MYCTPVEKREYLKDNGELVKGVMINSYFEHTELRDDQYLEDYREWFLLENGDLKAFITTHTYREGHKNSRNHIVARVEDPEVDLCEMEYDPVMFRIFELLQDSKTEFEGELKSLQDNLDKLQRE